MNPVPTPEFSDYAIVETDVPIPPELAAAIAANPDQHDFAARPPELPTPPPMPPQAPPQPIAAGTYAVYDDGNGGAVLVLQPKGGETMTKHLPAALIKMAERFGGAGAGPFAGLFGGGA